MIENREDRPDGLPVDFHAAALTADEREAVNQYIIAMTEEGGLPKQIAEALEIPLRRLTLYIKDDSGLAAELQSIREAGTDNVVATAHKRLEHWLNEGAERTQTTLLQFVLKNKGGFADKAEIKVQEENVDPVDLGDFASRLASSHRTRKDPGQLDDVAEGFVEGKAVDVFEIIEGSGN
jgi:hypothetical protein